MRLLVAALLGGATLLASPASGELQFPYQTTVISDDVYVRSGPGQNYYPTDKLRRGQEVEVYRHDPGGWCAIRPVDGSFAWVSGRYIRPTEDPLAVVTDEGVSARVGSRFSEIRDVVQVRLQKGEVVEILEEPAQGSRGSDAWFKIAPPAGEFRWVSAKYLSTEYPHDGIRKAPPSEQEHDRGNRHAEEATAAELTEPSAPMIPAAALAADESNDESNDAAGESLRTRSSHPRSLTAEEYEAELERVDLELSVMVIEEPAVWSFDALRDRANYLLDQSQTAVERGRARLLANKIARFDDIKQRQDTVLAMRSDTDRDSRLLTKLRPPDTEVENRAAKLKVDGRFDGVGQLTQVVSPKTGAPRYALLDKATGDVQCYVTPVPGVHLHNYIGREVGINGTRGYMPEQRAGHIMARHITPLEASGSVLR